ncbi:MAG: hypothetical protein KDC82_05295, partial [Bacteroidetes bacterium]|nr:hypothetical protein [Bacteroidota bacterium]
SGGVFRGVNFYMMEDELAELEESRYNVTFSYEDIDEAYYYYLGYDIDFDIDNYAYLDYVFDLYGIVEIYADVYLESNKLALDFYNAINAYYTNLLGPGTMDSDGWILFEGQYEEDLFDLYIKLQKDVEYGDFVSLEIYYME